MIFKKLEQDEISPKNAATAVVKSTKKTRLVRLISESEHLNITIISAETNDKGKTDTN